MTRLGTRSLLLAIDGTDYTDSVSKALIVSRSNGERPLGQLVDDHAYALALTAAQDTAAGTLWGLAWARAGERVDFHLAPYGNQTATADQPHFNGTVVVDEPDGDFLGGTADPSRRKVMQVSLEWQIAGRPDLLVDGDYPALLPEGW